MNFAGVLSTSGELSLAIKKLSLFEEDLGIMGEIERLGCVARRLISIRGINIGNFKGN